MRISDWSSDVCSSDLFFLLAASAVQLYATRRALWCAALGLLALGIAIELAQFAFTSSRSMDPRDVLADALGVAAGFRSEEHTSELQSLMRISYAVFCLKKKKKQTRNQ